MSSELMEYKTNKGAVKLTTKVVRDYLVSGKKNLITDDEIMHFINMCYYQKLNPWLREAYLIKYGSDSPASMVVGKDVFLKRASHNPKFQGHKAEAIENENGKVVSAWAEVYVKDYQVPIRVTVDFKEYVQNNRMWNSKPKTMIRKVALAQALREAFPEDFEGLYSEEEMPIGDVELERKPVKQPDVENGEIEDESGPANITPEQIAELTVLAKDLGYKNPSFELYKTQADYEAVKRKFKKLKEQIDKINILRKERDLQPKFEEKYKDIGWGKLFSVKLDRLLGIIEDLKQQPLANEIEQVKPKKSTKAEKIQQIKDGLTELGYTENSPEVTKMLQPYGAFNVKQLDSLSNAKLDEILHEEFAQE